MIMPHVTARPRVETMTERECRDELATHFPARNSRTTALEERIAVCIGYGWMVRPDRYTRRP